MFRIRIGLHTGAVELGGEDYVGLAVHQASRVGAAAHGGQVVLTETTRQLVGERAGRRRVSFNRLGSYQLKDFPEATVIYQLCHPELAGDFPALRAMPAAAHNLPEQATLFVGRHTALRELADLVTEHRLVTVLGAGGVGKTRLASEVVPHIVNAFDDGVWMVELAKLRDGLAAAAEVAASLGMRADAERGLEATIAEALELKRMLRHPRQLRARAGRHRQARPAVARRLPRRPHHGHEPRTAVAGCRAPLSARAVEPARRAEPTSTDQRQSRCSSTAPALSRPV